MTPVSKDKTGLGSFDFQVMCFTLVASVSPLPTVSRSALSHAQ